MKNKGLCETCVSDKSCSFYRIYPVIECEEFQITEPKRALKVKKGATKSGTRKN